MLLTFLGPGARACLEPRGRLPGVVSYFLGRDPRSWRGYPHLRRVAGTRPLSRHRPGVLHRPAWPGIRLCGRAGADPGRIRIATAGAAPHARDGDLVWRTAGGMLVLAAPSIYQRGVRARPAGGYGLGAGGPDHLHRRITTPRREGTTDPNAVTRSWLGSWRRWWPWPPWGVLDPSGFTGTRVNTSAEPVARCPTSLYSRDTIEYGYDTSSVSKKDGDSC